jgi:hypothetical protein
MSYPPLYLCPHMKTKATTKKKPPATRKITPVELHLATLQRHIAQGGNPNDELTHAKYAKTLDALTAASDRPTINAEAVDELFEQTIANLMALQDVWQKISLKEELK